MKRVKPRRGLFIVLEGSDKSGKSTQASLLAADLRAKGRDVLHTREPGGTSFAEAIRTILLDPKNQVDPLAELFLYEAARAQHTREKLLPALKAGKVVVSERYTMATLAYQGFARGLPLPLVRKLNDAASSGLKPDLTILLDVPDGALEKRGRERTPDRLERESALFRERVRRGYRTLARSERKVVVLDGSQSVEVLREKIGREAERLLR